jgi:hypothetical protein
VGRYHGRNGRIYFDIAGGGSAAPLNFMANWSINFATDKVEVTAMGDSNKVFVAGLPDASGEFSGFHDDATMQTYTAAVDGIARKFYLYPSTLDTTKYFFGTILADFNVSSGVAGAGEVTSSWNAASTVARVPAV